MIYVIFSDCSFTAVEAGIALMALYDGLLDNLWVGEDATRHLVDLLADLLNLAT